MCDLSTLPSLGQETGCEGSKEYFANLFRGQSQASPQKPGREEVLSRFQVLPDVALTAFSARENLLNRPLRRLGVYTI